MVNLPIREHKNQILLYNTKNTKCVVNIFNIAVIIYVIKFMF